MIVDKKNNNTAVDDSYKIALYLEEKYPNSPSLFHGGVGVHKFFQNYADHNVLPPIFKLLVVDLCKLSGPVELQDWFRKDRESRFKVTLEEFSGDAETNIALLNKGLYPIVKMLDKFSYMTGDQGIHIYLSLMTRKFGTQFYIVGWADIVLASYFTFLEALKPELFETAVLNAFGNQDKRLASWWYRMEKYRKGISSANL